jgi:hypothetical protein
VPPKAAGWCLTQALIKPKQTIAKQSFVIPAQAGMGFQPYNNKLVSHTNVSVKASSV